MLITVWTSSQRLDEILSDAQKAQIYSATPKNIPERVVIMKVKTAGRTIHIENGAVATTANSFPLSANDVGITLPLSWLSDYNLIADEAGTEVYLLSS